MEKEFKNTSGIKNLCEYKCLVLPDPVEETTPGGLIAKPQIVMEKEKWRTTKATFILASNAAFQDFRCGDKVSYIPQPGDRVYISIAAGIIHEGPDGKEYRIIRDKDVAAEVDE